MNNINILEIIELVKEKYSYGRKGHPCGGLESAPGAVEYKGCVEFLGKQENLNGFIEVGSAWGASFHLWAHCIPNGPKISVDLYGPYPGLNKDQFLFRNELWSQYFDDAVSILGNSTHKETINSTRSALKGEKVSFLYIDGDHSYDGVKADYLNYKEFVKSGGFIGFHDVNPQEKGVYKFWNEVKKEYSTAFVIENTIGILQV